jgi:hypothetical protein
MSDRYCPNCGHPLVDYRTDRQPVGAREVVLQWSMCGSCRHVGLKQWQFANGVLPNPPETNGHTPQAGRTGQTDRRVLQHAER